MRGSDCLKCGRFHRQVTSDGGAILPRLAKEQRIPRRPKSVSAAPAPALLRMACLLGVVLLLCGSTQLRAQETNPEPPTDAQKQNDTAESMGLPKQVKWTFNLDAAGGWFGFGNSLYTNNKPEPDTNLSDNWMEGFVKPALSGIVPVGKSEFYGKISVVGERTFNTPPSLVGEDASSFLQEDMYVGWRSGKSLGGSDNLLDITVGRAPYTIGHGFLVWDGAGEGGSRGGYWSNARKAWRYAAIVRLKPGNHKIEGFFLGRDDVPENRTQTRLAGVNYEYAAGNNSTFGATYFKTYADRYILPDRNGMNVLNARAYTAIPGLSDLSFDLEYAYEKNADLMQSHAWSAQGAYQLSTVHWKPKLSYRYAYFQGNDPKTAENQAFDPLYVGFYDWGTWWQGEIAGEYFLSNSNNISHQARLHLTPSDSLGCGEIAYWFLIPQPASFGPGATSTHAAFELDTYADWKINKHFTLSAVGAWADPEKGVEQAYHRTKNFTYGMLYMAYSF